MNLDPTQPGPEQLQPSAEQPGATQQEPPNPSADMAQPGPYYEYAPRGNETAAPSVGNSYAPFHDPQYFYGAPPAPYYGTPLKPLPLVDAIAQLPLQYWRVLRKPGARVFAEESGKARWDILLVQLIGYTIIDALLGWLHLTLYPLTAQAVPTTAANGVDVAKIESAELAILTFAFGLGLFILVPLGFFIYQGIAFGLARAFRGQGSFVTQSYTLLLIYVPIGMIDIALTYLGLSNAVLGLFTTLLSLGLPVYGIVLTVFAMMGAHRLSGGKASAVALLPFLGILLFACCGLFIALFPAISSAVPPQ